MLEIKNVFVTFNKGSINEKQALRGVDLKLETGDFVTVIGSNGAGKSTLLNTVSGRFPMESGSIVLDGIDISRLKEYKRAKYISRVFQDPLLGTASNMSIEENLSLASRRGKIRSLKWYITGEERVQFKELIKSLNLGLENRMEQKAGTLSGGQRQAITLLMASLRQPKLLLLDEHTAALDPKTAEKVLDVTKRITSEKNLTTIMVTHNMKDALAFGNRLIMMNEGKIIVDVKEDDKKKLQVADLLEMFAKASGGEMMSDKAILS